MTVYTLTNKINGKVYVGATTISMARRMGGHRQDAKKGKTTLIAQAIREHGWGMFDVAIIGRADSLSSLLAKEAETIQRMKTLTPNGYNRCDFSSHRNLTVEEKARLSRSVLASWKRGRQAWNLGLKTGPMSEATKEKQRCAHLGQRAWNRGMQHTDEAKLRMREAHAAIEHHYNERAVEVDGVVYPSLVSARQALGLTKMQLRYRLTTGRARYA